MKNDEIHTLKLGSEVLGVRLGQDYIGSGVTGGGQSAPQRLLTGKFLLTYREKKETRRKIEKKRRKIVKGKVENWKYGSRKSNIQRADEDLFFFFLLFTFENDGNLFWVYQNGNFLPGKIIR